MPEITIIIPTRQRDEIFSETINAAVLAVKNIDAEIIVINDFPEKEIKLHNDKVRVVNNLSRGVTVARNYGAKLAGAELILFIDNDIIITENNLQRTLSLHKKYNNIISNANWTYPDHILSKIKDSSLGRVLIRWKLNSFKDRYEAMNRKWSEQIFEAKYPFAAFYFSIEKKNYLATRGFNEQNIVGGEEEEFSNDLTKLGIKFIIDPQNIVLHNEKDRTFDYKEWLNRIRLSSQQKSQSEITNKSNVFKYLGFIEKPLHAILLNLPNKKIYDRLYARTLSVLKNVIMNKS